MEMKISFVETNYMIGWTSKYTDATMIIATKFKSSRNNMQQLNKFKEIWIDNGAYESGVNNPINFTKAIKKQLQLANKLKDNHQVFLILPDVLLNYYDTSIAFFRYFNQFKENEHPNINFVGVIQGTTTKDVYNMCNIYKSNNIKYIGIPKKMRELPQYFDLECQIIEYYKPEYIHYLGFVEQDKTDDLLLQGIHSMDTKHPIKMSIVSNDNDYFDMIVNRSDVESRIEKFIKEMKQ